MGYVLMCFEIWACDLTFTGVLPMGLFKARVEGVSLQNCFIFAFGKHPWLLSAYNQYLC